MKPARTLMRTLASAVLVVAVAAANTRGTDLKAQSDSTESSVPGDARRGKTLFNEAYGCGSCHGVYGTAGTPRLVPMARSQANFIQFVRKPTAPAMPAFADATDRQLADVYAYIKSIPVPTPPPVESIPILNDVMKTIR